LCVGTHRVDALRRVIEHRLQSAPTPVPTQSVGTIRRGNLMVLSIAALLKNGMNLTELPRDVVQKLQDENG
ncbi:MAG: hypothetical protein JJU32_16170, partial [Phormidium sp. BM_Day4_Bin.17]|nr:hypothetical protein [Phormidium sp. BM_Day4_Bin.17]